MLTVVECRKISIFFTLSPTENEENLKFSRLIFYNADKNSIRLKLVFFHLDFFQQ